MVVLSWINPKRFCLSSFEKKKIKQKFVEGTRSIIVCDMGKTNTAIREWCNFLPYFIQISKSPTLFQTKS